MKNYTSSRPPFIKGAGKHIPDPPKRRHTAKYTVWVGGGEITDYYVDRYAAEIIAKQFIEQGYDDVRIERINQ